MFGLSTWPNRARERVVRVVARGTIFGARALRFEQVESRQLLAAVIVSPMSGLQTSEDGGGCGGQRLSEGCSDDECRDQSSERQPFTGNAVHKSLTFTPGNFETSRSRSAFSGRRTIRFTAAAYYHVLETIQSTDATYAALHLPTRTIKSTIRGLAPGVAVSPASRNLQVPTKSGGAPPALRSSSRRSPSPG